MDWGDTKVLVTGADGFIGSHLVQTLMARGAQIRALCQYNSFGDIGHLAEIENRDVLDIRLGDIRDREFCRKLSDGIDVVFHLAALIGIPYSYAAPQSYIDTNVTGSFNMAMASLEAGCDRFIHTSTSEVYGTAIMTPISESHPLQPQSPYSASKIGADSIVKSLYHSFELPVVLARPFNTYGPRQSQRAVIPTIISQILNGYTTIELGDLETTRDFNYVQDTCDAFLLLAECDEALGRVVHFGSGTEISIGLLAKTVMKSLGREVKIIQDSARLRPAGSEVRRLLADNSLVHELCGYHPKVSLEEGIVLTAEYLTKKVHAGARAKYAI